MTTAIRAAVTYGLDADAYLVARAVDSALEGIGFHVSVEEVDGEDEVRICRRGAPATEAVRFEPGQRLVVTYDRSWRIEAAPAIEAVAS